MGLRLRMTVLVGLVLVGLSLLVATTNGVPVGNLLYRTFLIFSPQPLTVKDAQSQGWIQFSAGCDPKLGIAYSQGDQSGPTLSNSAILYFTSGGQIAGFGTRVWGQPPSSLVGNFWKPVNGQDGVYDISIAFRNSSMMCSGKRSTDVLGDQVSINQFFNIPLSMAGAAKAGWVEGDCIPEMGIHHAYDLNAPGNQTWNISSLVPVLPMYNSETKAISAILFWMPDVQRVEPFGDWEGPFPPFIFCKNWCADSGCKFGGVNFFTTMHWMFTDPSKNTCSKARCVV
jgi:hypothetical protein